MSRDSCERCPETSHLAPKGIRTPDLLAASQNGLNGVLTCENAGRERAKTPKLWGEKSELGDLVSRWHPALDGSAATVPASTTTLPQPSQAAAEGVMDGCSRREADQDEEAGRVLRGPYRIFRSANTER